jgi:hypothetical protein
MVYIRVALVFANYLYSASALTSEKTVRERRKAIGKHKRTFIEFSPCLYAGKESTIEKERKTLITF